MLEMNLAACMFPDPRHIAPSKTFDSPVLDRQIIPADGFASLKEGKIAVLAIFRWRWRFRSQALRRPMSQAYSNPPQTPGSLEFSIVVQNLAR